MLIRPVVLLVASLLAPLATQGQQSLNPQPAVLQAQALPCITAPPTLLQPKGDSLTVKPPTKWKQYLDERRKAIESQYGVHVPDVLTPSPSIFKPAPVPCPPKIATPAVLPPAPVMKLPPDTSVTFHCNPLSPAKDSTGHQTLTLPDPHDFAVPKPGDFEADSVVPDLAAKTPCYLIKVDPKTQKSFVQQ